MEDKVSEEIQQVKKEATQTGMPPCRFHKNCQADYLLLLGNSFLSLCEQCRISDKFDGKVEYMTISHMYQQDKSFVNQEWPPVKDLSLFQQLKNEIDEVAEVEQIEQLFQDLEERFINVLRQKKNEEIEKLKELKSYQQELIEAYQNFLKAEEFRKYFDVYRETRQVEDKEKVINYLMSRQNLIDQNTQQLEDILKKHRQNKPKLEISKLNDFSQNIIKKTQNFNLVTSEKYIAQKEYSELQLSINQLLSNKSNFVTQQFLSQFNQAFEEAEYIFQSTIDQSSIIQKSKKPIPFHQLKDQDFKVIENYAKKLLKPDQIIQPTLIQTKEIMNLICNKFNFLNQDFILEFQNILSTIEPVFINLNVSSNRMYKPNLNPNKLGILSDKSLQNIYQLCQKINSNYSSDIKTKEMSNIVYQNLSPLCKNKEKIKNLLLDYPIFELLEKGDIYENGIIPQIYGTLEKCIYSDSQKIACTQKLCQKITIESFNRSFGGAFFKYELSPGKKYVARFQFEEIIKNFIIIGVLQKDTAFKTQIGKKNQSISIQILLLFFMF